MRCIVGRKGEKFFCVLFDFCEFIILSIPKLERNPRVIMSVAIMAKSLSIPSDIVLFTNVLVPKVKIFYFFLY